MVEILKLVISMWLNSTSSYNNVIWFKNTLFFKFNNGRYASVIEHFLTIMLYYLTEIKERDVMMQSIDKIGSKNNKTIAKLHYIIVIGGLNR